MGKALFGLVASMAMGLGFPAGVAGGDEPVTIELVRQALQRRQSKIQTLSVEWNSKRFIPAGGLNTEQQALARLEAIRNNPLDAPPTHVEIGTVPPADYEVSTESRLVIDRDRIRYEYSSPKWSRSTNEFVVKPYACVLANGTATSLRMTGSTAAPHPTVGVKEAGQHPDVFDASLRPMMLTLFGTDPKRQPYSLGTLNIVPRQPGGGQLVELWRNVGPSSKETLWLDPARGYIPTRVIHTTDTAISLDISIVHEPHPVCEWIPKSWTVKSCQPSGSLERQQTCEVKSCRVNEPVPETEFRVDLPTGAIVVKSQQDSMTFSIVERDGSQRTLTQGEIETPYEDLIKARWAYEARRKRLLIGLLVGLGAVAVGVVYVYRSRRRRAGAGGVSTNPTR